VKSSWHFRFRVVFLALVCVLSLPTLPCTKAADSIVDLRTVAVGGLKLHYLTAEEKPQETTNALMKFL
jgi:hypothetical protein